MIQDSWTEGHFHPTADCIIEEDAMNMGATGSRKWTASAGPQSSSEACGTRGQHRAWPGAGAPSGRPGAGSGRCPAGACGGHGDRQGAASLVGTLVPQSLPTPVPVS